MKTLELPKETPLRKTVAQYLAEQTETNAEDWVPIPTGTRLHKLGYRWWNTKTNQHAKRANK